jgi:hypothetical protein
LLVNRVGPDTTVETRDCFSIVVEYVWFGVEDRVECCFVAVEVWNQNFDFAFRIPRPDLSNRLGPVSGAAVRQVIAVY